MASMRPYQLLRELYDDAPNERKGGIQGVSAEDLLAEWVQEGTTPPGGESRVRDRGGASSPEQRLEAADQWLGRIGDLVRTHYLSPQDGGEKLSPMTLRRQASEAPMIRDVAPDVVGAADELRALLEKRTTGGPDFSRTSEMDRITVLVAPDGPAGGIRDVLRDLSAAGLVEPFLWVREAAVLAARADGRAIPATRVAAGRQEPTTLMAALTHVRHRIVSICSLVPLVGGAPAARSEAESETVNRLRAQLGGARVVQVRCLLAMHDDTAPEEVLARDGWHNLLVAQEDARGPEEAHELLPRSAGPVGLARHAAPVLAGVLGLWTGMTAGCLDDLPVPPQRQIRLVRGFYRRVDASAAETTLRHRVLATGTMPLPRQHGSVAVHVPDAAEACYKMANALCNKHPGVLPGSASQCRTCRRRRSASGRCCAGSSASCGRPCATRRRTGSWR